MKVSELREALSERGLPTNGKRDELVARLELLSRLESADAVNPLASPNLEAACSSVAAPSEEGTASSASTQLAQGTSATSRVVLIEALQAAEDRASKSEAARVELEMGRLDDWAARASLAKQLEQAEALAGVETEVCTHARLVVGNFAAASTQEICRRRRWAAQRKGKRTRRGLRTLVLPCVDALGRELPHELDELLLG